LAGSPDLAGELRLEGADLEVDHDEPASRMVVEEQVEDELLPSDLQRPLSPSEVEALTKSEHETLDVAQQSRLQVTLPGALGQLHEIQHQRVAGDSLHSLSIARLQGLLEIRDGRRLTLMQPSRDRRLELRP